MSTLTRVSSPFTGQVKKRITRDGLSLAFAVGLYAIAFGAASVSSGLSVLQTCLLSLLLFSGASQFAIIGVGKIASIGTAISATIGALLLGSRNALYGLRMAPILKARGIRRVAAAQLTIDESTGVAIAQEEWGLAGMRHGFWVTGLGVYFFWNLFTFIGAIGADAVGDPSRWGLDAAVPAAFLGLVWGRIKDKQTRIVAISSGIFVLVLIPIMPAGAPVISCALIALLAGWRK